MTTKRTAPKSKSSTRRLAPISKYPVYRKLLKIEKDLISLRGRLNNVLPDVYDMEFENKALKNSNIHG